MRTLPLIALLLTGCQTEVGVLGAPETGWTAVFDSQYGDFPAELALANDGLPVIAMTSFNDHNNLVHTLEIEPTDGEMTFFDAHYTQGVALALLADDHVATAVTSPAPEPGLLVREFSLGGIEQNTFMDYDMEPVALDGAAGGFMSMLTWDANTNRWLLKGWEAGTSLWTIELTAGEREPVDVVVDGEYVFVVMDGLGTRPTVQSFDRHGEQRWVSGELCGQDIASDGAGGLYAAGATPDDGAVQLCRVDNKGGLVWHQRNVIDWEQWVGVSDIAVRDGMIVLIGSAYEEDVPAVQWTWAYDESGQALWADRWAGSDGGFAMGREVVIGANGAVFTAGIEWQQDYAMVMRRLEGQ